MRIFLISADESMIEFIAVVVESDIKVNRVLPKIRYKGKFSISNRKNVLNTADKTIIINSGLSTDHKTPSMLRRYFNLKSLETSEDKINQLRCNADFWLAATWKPPAIYKYDYISYNHKNIHITILFYRIQILRIHFVACMHMKCMI